MLYNKNNTGMNNLIENLKQLKNIILIFLIDMNSDDSGYLTNPKYNLLNP